MDDIIEKTYSMVYYDVEYNGKSYTVELCKNYVTQEPDTYIVMNSDGFVVSDKSVVYNIIDLLKHYED